MHQYEKLFDKSEIEYITPFLKLWMAFNSWYKKQISVKNDRQAIAYYKKRGTIKDAFLRMLESKAAKYSDFQRAVAEFVEISENSQHQVSEIEWNRDSTYLYRTPSKDDISENLLEYLAEQNKNYFIYPDFKEDFFSDVLENIYQVRCCLVHGDFDIENQHFIDLICCTYFVLYPVMQDAMANKGSNIWYCKNSQGTEAQAQIDKNGSMKVLEGSQIRAKTMKSYKRVGRRQKLLEANGVLEEEIYTLNSSIIFPSYSAASSFCMGNSSNGWIDWKDKDGKTIDEVIRGQ